MSCKAKEELEIFRGVPVPNRVDRRSYPFNQLEVDECFIVECDDIKHERSVRSSATSYSAGGRRYIVRRMPGTEKTVGVWRVS